MIHELTRNTENTYMYRVFDRPNTVDYKFTLPISYRENGEFEVHGWNSIKKLWPDAPLSWWGEGMYFIQNEIKRVDLRFMILTGKFRSDKFKFVERLFRGWAELVVLRIALETHNGDTKEFTTACFNFHESLFGEYTY